MGIHDYKYSKKSREKLDQCDPKLQRALEWMLTIFDHSVRTGHRSEQDQNDAVKRGASKRKWPLSKHNSKPSRASDVDVYPSDLSVLRRDPTREIDAALDSLVGYELEAEAAAIVEHLRENLIPHSREFGLARERLSHFFGCLIGVADAMGFGIKWGGDWQRNGRLAENKFDDLYHVELDD